MGGVTAAIGALRAGPRIGVLRWAEAGLTVLFMLLFSQALLGPLLATPENPEGSVILRLMWLPVYAATLLLLCARPMASLGAALRTPLILFLALLCVASMLWSVDSGLTVRRGFALLMTTLFGLWLASRWRWPDLVAMIAVSFALLAFGSFVASALFPGFGVHADIHAGAWRGLWWEKNTLGAQMAFGAAASLAAAAFFPRWRLLWFAVFAFQAGLVVMSTSRTALLMLLIVAAGAAGIALVRQGVGLALMVVFGGLTGAALIALVAFVAPEEALRALGRDATLTGRTDIWEVLARMIAERPWTGYGYGAFWAEDFGPSFRVRLETQWPVPTAHNGWLETALAIGIPGTILMALAYLLTLGRAALRLFSGAETYWTLAFLAAYGVVSLSESNLLQQNGLSWVLFCAIAAKLAAPREAG